MKRVLMWSGGKDSTATAIVAKLNGLPIDRIVTVMPDPFRCELELLARFQDWMGMRVEIVDGPKFDDFFWRVKVRGKNKGGIYGWPKIRQKACARMLKWKPQAEWHRLNPGHQAIVGIAADELRRMTGVQRMNDISYLGMEGVTQAGARALCEAHGLLNPLYARFKRMGCVRCPKQCKAALETVRELEPEKWGWMVEHDKKSPVTFRPGKTLAEFMSNPTGQPPPRLGGGSVGPGCSGSE